MPTSREFRAKRLMHKSTLEDLQMPTFVSKPVVPPVKENDLYPFKWPGYKTSDVQKKINRVLEPLSLFAPYPHEDEPEPELVLERPVTPINEEIRSQPTCYDKLRAYVRRRIAAQERIPYLTVEDQQDLAAIIMGEVNHIWPDVRRQINYPFMSDEENKELNRRITVHIVTVCEKLFNHYLHKALILNERGVFSGPANMSRLKAQLALDADKFLNVTTIRRYLVGDMRGKMRGEPVEIGRLQSRPRPQTPARFRHPPRSHQTTTEQPLVFEEDRYRMMELERDLKEIAEAMPYLDTNKLVDLVADLPDRITDTPATDSQSEASPCPMKDDSRTSMALIQDLASREAGPFKRCKSALPLHAGETLLQELGIEESVKRDPLLDNELRFLRLEQQTLHKEKSKVVSKPEPGSAEFMREDLKQLMQDGDPEGTAQEGEDDLPPLIQAITRHARHDDMKEKLQQKLQELEQREKDRRESEMIEVQVPIHPQPATVNARFGNRMMVRASDVRVSERVCLSSIVLSRYATVYNDLIEEIDPVTVKNLDKNLFLSNEIREVYQEIMKTLPSDHLNLDHDEMVVSAPDTVNVADTLASSTLSGKVSKRVINPALHRHTQPPWGAADSKDWARTPTNPPKNFQGEDLFAPLVRYIQKTPNLERVHNAMHNPGHMTQLMTSTASLPSPVADRLSRSYASWLQWWKSTVTSDDYMKYLSTLDTDFMGVVFHFYDSEDEDSEDEDAAPAKGPVIRRNLSTKQQQELLEREKKLEELRSVKNEYKEGMWNANCILMGGLGKDPSLDEEAGGDSSRSKGPDGGRQAVRTLQERAAQARLAKLPQKRALSRTSKSTGGLSETVATSEAGEAGEDSESERAPQERLESVWNSLRMPDAQRLDMAIKYSSDAFFPRLLEAVEHWEEVTGLVLQRETLLAKLEDFERHASDPNRFFQKENGKKKSSVLLLEEARYRAYIYKKIEVLDADIKTEMDYMKIEFQDVVSFKGRPYEDKLKWDRTEMLHWLQEERKSNALRYEAILHHKPPLQPLPSLTHILS